MARLVLLDGSDAAATALRAVAAGHAVVAARRSDGPVPGDVLIVEIRRGENLAPSLNASTGWPRRLLILADAGASIDTSAVDKRCVTILQKPFDLIDLRLQLRALLDTPLDATEPTAEQPWLEVPLLTPAAAATLAAARLLGGAVWIVGENGTGSDRVAAALARCWDAEREPIVWAESDALAPVVARLGDDGRVLWAPAIDERPLREQRAFERLLAMEPTRRIVVTAGDDPGEAVAAGTLLRSLHDCLGRQALRLVPLRERPADVAALAVSIGSRVCSSIGASRFMLADDARQIIESYPWPGNVTELDAVITRSTVGLVAGAGLLDAARAGASATPGASAAGTPSAVLEVRAEALRFSAPLWPGSEAPSLDEIAATQPASRRAVVLAMDAARAVKTSDAAQAVAMQRNENKDVGQEPPSSRDHTAGVEALLAAFAHDIRNPMSTIKTFAGLQAAGDGGSELGRLAVAACERIDAQLEFLQRYAEIAPGAASRVDLVEALGEASDATSPAPLSIVARTALWVRVDPVLARFVADALVAECRSRMPSDAATGRADHDQTATADLAAGGSALEIRIPVGGAAVDRLGKWVEGQGLPWRLALAREAARRSGGDLDVITEDGEMRVRWRLPLAEERSNDDEAGSPDRRRRSRSS